MIAISRRRLIALALCLGLILSLLSGCGEKELVTAEDLTAGLNYLRELEAKDPNMIQQLIQTQRAEKIAAMRDDYMKMLESDPEKVWPLFQDYVLLGDSRTVGFSYYGFLPESLVWAESGATIMELDQQIPELVAKNPAYVYLQYGINDFVSAIWDYPEDYARDYQAEIQLIRDSLPNAEIYVCSILPVSAAAYERGSFWDGIADYNKAILEMTKNIDKCYYVDGDATAQKYMDLWEADGVHFQSEFYPHWAACMMMEVFNAHLDADLAQSDGRLPVGEGAESAEPSE